MMKGYSVKSKPEIYCHLCHSKLRSYHVNNEIYVELCNKCTVQTYADGFEQGLKESKIPGNKE